MKQVAPTVLVFMLAAASGQSPGHPFDSSKIHASIDSFVVVTRVTGGAWRPVAGVVQTIARDSTALRISVDYSAVGSRQRTEMALEPGSLAPLAHWESLFRQGRGETKGEVMFSGGRARGAFILSKNIIDMPLDTGIIDDDASTALLPALPFGTDTDFTFRTFAAPGQVEITRVRVTGSEAVSVPAGRFDAWRLHVMARDTSDVFVSKLFPRRVLLVRLANGMEEMRLINRPSGSK
jgi:hypothetical protein